MSKNEVLTRLNLNQMDISYWFAYVFNRTALGLGVLVAMYLLWTGDVLRGVGILALVPVYFYLHDRLDAP